MLSLSKINNNKLNMIERKWLKLRKNIRIYPELWDRRLALSKLKRERSSWMMWSMMKN
jgi:hypothetical protein